MLWEMGMEEKPDQAGGRKGSVVPTGSILTNPTDDRKPEGGISRRIT